MVWNRIAATGLLAFIGMAAPATARASDDLSGVWVVTKYATEIKTSDGKAPPLLPEAAKTYAERKALLAKGDHSFDIVSTKCGPPGMPRVMALPYKMEIVQNPRRIVFLFEWNRMYRRVDLTTPSGSADDYQMHGVASGQWQGDTLVITTEKIDDTFLDAAGMPHSMALKITERLHMLSNGTLENRVRFEDPETFSAPWETVVTYRKLPKGTEVGEDVCLDRIGTTAAIDDKNYLKYAK